MRSEECRFPIHCGRRGEAGFGKREERGGRSGAAGDAEDGTEQIMEAAEAIALRLRRLRALRSLRSAGVPILMSERGMLREQQRCNEEDAPETDQHAREFYARLISPGIPRARR